MAGKKQLSQAELRRMVAKEFAKPSPDRADRNGRIEEAFHGAAQARDDLGK